MQEIRIDDPFGSALVKYSTGLEVGVEIGGGTGDGSTQCIKTRLLYSFENHPDRIGRHGMNLSSREGGVAIHENSSDPEKWMSEDEIIGFYKTTQTNLNAYPLDMVLGWRNDDVFHASKYPRPGIHAVDLADFLLLDGGAFSGIADFNEWMPRLKKGGVVSLDDVNDIKNHANYHRLKAERKELVWENLQWRNGCAIFRNS